ncbi:MAG: DNA (cytosine-5-)-methyltransferase [Lagierella massiliensis]|nr:DNA (cytosine-5-)-methyltransferase [Lagierella massiliensis]
MKIKTFFDFCSGIGGGRLGLENCGLECVGSSDTSRLANTTYDLLFPGKSDKNYGNLKNFNKEKYPNFDILIAGFPCQSFSVIGRQTGTKDPRGQIIYYLMNIIEQTKPQVFILENVKGLISHDGGKTFNEIIHSLSNIGYSVFYKVLNSLDYGVPHMRQRVFIVGFKENLNISKNQFKWPQPMQRVNIENFLIPSDNEMSPEDKKWFYYDYLNNDKNHGKFDIQDILSRENLIVDTRMSDLRLYVNRMPTLRAHRDGIYYVQNKKMYYLTGAEALLFQGFTHQHINRVKNKVSNRHLLMQAGNAMTANVVEAIGKSILEATK